MDDIERAAVVAAIEEVLATYVEAGWTLDGVPDVGPALIDLGRLVGMDIERTVLIADR